MKIVCFIFAILIKTGVFGHTWMLEPQPRLADLCIPVKTGNSNCCAPKPNSVSTTYQRGQIIQTNWGRNNHLYGFNQYSIVKLSNSDIPDIFNKDENIYQYTCYGTDCTGANNNPFAGDPTGTAFNGLKCNVKFQIPSNLDDGDYTLQWRWFASGDSFNIRNLGLVDFVTCHDFKISGGPKLQKPSCPLFIANDIATPNLNACEYFKDPVINACIDDHTCKSWFAKGVPQKIADCPSNIITYKDSQVGNFKGKPLPLYVGPTTHNLQNPEPNLQARLPVIKTNVSPTVQKNKDSMRQLCVCGSDLEQYCNR